MSEIVFKAHKVSRGKAQGKALVSNSAVSFMGGVDARTGVVLDKGHELEGVSIADRILIYPTGKGSSAGSWIISELAYWKKAPRAIVVLRADPVVAGGAIVGRIPMVDKPEPDPLKIVKTGDIVEVDADLGTVRLVSKSGPA